MSDDNADDDCTTRTPSNIPSWSDFELKEMNKTYKFALNKWNPKTTKVILKRFFNFYFTGQIPPEDNLIATVHDCVSIAHVNNHRLFNPRFTGKIYYQENVSIPTSITSEIQGISEGPAVLRKLSAFHSYIRKTVDEFNTKSSTSTSEKQLLALAGFLALTFCRFATKNLKQMMIGFNDGQYRVTLESVTGWPQDKPFAPPVKEVLNSCGTKLGKSSPETRILFCILADEMVRAYAPGCPKPVNQRYLNSSVLADTAYNGLGLIKMLMDVCEFLKTSWRDIRTLLFDKHSEASCKRIDEFFINYLEKGEHGFAWARIIDDGYLRGYSPKENEFLCIAFTAIIEYERGPAVWQAPWIKPNVSFYSAAKQKGKDIYENKKMNRKGILAKCTLSLPGACTVFPNGPLKPIRKRPQDNKTSQCVDDGAKLFEYYNGPDVEVAPIPVFINKATRISEESSLEDWKNFWYSYREILNNWSRDGYNDVVRHLFKSLKHGLLVAVECVKMGKLSIMSVKASQYDKMMCEVSKLTGSLQDMNKCLKKESEAREAKNLDLIQRGTATLSALATLERSVKTIILQKN